MNLKGSVGLIFSKDSVTRVTIPIDLSTWSSIPFLTLVEYRLFLLSNEGYYPHRYVIICLRGLPYLDLVFYFESFITSLCSVHHGSSTQFIYSLWIPTMSSGPDVTEYQLDTPGLQPMFCTCL